MRLETDIHSSEEFIKKFCATYDLDNSKSFSEVMRDFFVNAKNEKSEAYRQFISDFKENRKPEIKENYVLLNRLNLGNNITVTYSPMSQKYIDHYEGQTISGRIIYIDEENDDLLLLDAKDDKYIVYSMERANCSYYGTSRGYFYTIITN
jgi:hypothetical protein